ncbi:HIT family protein [Nanoarchaeota archaeon]
MECPLCDALTQDYRLIYKDDLVFCIVCKEPVRPGHLLVLPVRHIEKISDLTPEELKRIHDFLDKLTPIVTGFGDDVIMGLNRGTNSTQPHLHYHILPSKGSLREVVAKFEGLPKRVAASMDEFKRIKDNVKENL